MQLGGSSILHLGSGSGMASISLLSCGILKGSHVVTLSPIVGLFLGCCGQTSILPHIRHQRQSQEMTALPPSLKQEAYWGYLEDSDSRAAALPDTAGQQR